MYRNIKILNSQMQAVYEEHIDSYQTATLEIRLNII